MCWKEPRCMLKNQNTKDFDQPQLMTLISCATFAEICYLLFFAVCVLNTVQFVVIQKRYKNILLFAFYVLALASLGAKNAAYSVDIDNYTKLYRNESITDADNLRCQLDFKQANRAVEIS